MFNWLLAIEYQICIIRRLKLQFISTTLTLQNCSLFWFKGQRPVVIHCGFIELLTMRE
ncbi:MAG: hypothetical protein JWP78_3391 [Mucilaginibacter sp.]|nr:hypothetical protein [Mucilaginibacter sp.]